MIERPTPKEYHAHFELYIALVVDAVSCEQLRVQLNNVIDKLSALTEDQAKYRYAPGKWSIKQVIGHLSDTERVMSYRLLRVARGDRTSLPAFHEESFMLHSPYDELSMRDVIEEFRAVRCSTIALCNGLCDEAWLRRGIIDNQEMSARALGYIITGHVIHHMKMIEERYLQSY